jgi:eukaryotic-like serine/threonine-protein kinase
MSLAPGTHLGPYEIGAPLGAGGTGKVYRANDERLNRDVAVKVLTPSTLTDENPREASASLPWLFFARRTADVSS